MYICTYVYIYNRTPFLSPSLPPAPTMRPLRVLRIMTLSAFPCGQAAESHVVYNKKCVNSDLLQSLATFVSLAETARCAGPSRCLGRRLARARGTLWTSRRTRVLPRHAGPERGALYGPSGRSAHLVAYSLGACYCPTKPRRSKTAGSPAPTTLPTASTPIEHVAAEAAA